MTKDGTLGVARIVQANAPEFSIFVSVAMLRPKHKHLSPRADFGRFLKAGNS